jgi:signal transduction histidine kinase
VLAGVASSIAEGERPPVPALEADEEVMQLARAMRIMRDAVAEREEALAFLAEASTLLASSLDFQTTLARLAHLVSPRLADFCIVDTVDDEGSIHRLAVATGDPMREELARAIQQRPPDPHALQGVPQVLRTGKTEVLAEVPDALFASLAQDAEHLDLLRAMHVQSHMIVPLTARGRTIGAITFVRSQAGRPYSSEDVAFAEDLARRAAVAIDNARLYGEAQTAIKARDEFLSVAAHELKTPLTSMRLSVDLAQRHLQQGGEADVSRLERAVGTVSNQVDKLTRLVSQLLDVARVEGGKLALEREVTDVTALVQAVMATAQARTSQHTLVVRADGPVQAFVDPLRLEQVLANLIDNAIKFSPDGGAIEVDLDEPDAQTVRIKVRDHGIGIPEERRTHIFNRFYQAHGGGHLGGMGLGLYISGQITELHGGTIAAEFPESGGTCFVLTLPVGSQLKCAE